LIAYRSKSEPDLRVAGQDEPVPILERPAAINENGAAWNQASRAFAIDKLLTPREAELARFVAAGLSNKQIAQKASIAEGTVKLHLHNAYQKLGLANRTGLAVFMFGSDAGARDQRR